MNKDHAQLTELLQAYLENKLDYKDYESFFNQLASLPEAELTALLDAHAQVADTSGLQEEFINQRLHKVQERIAQQVEPSPTILPQSKIKQSRIWMAAAAAVLLLTIAAQLYKKYSQESSDIHTQVVLNKIDIDPGGDAAVLLVGGKKMQLEGEKAGIKLSDSSVYYLDGSLAIGKHSQEIELITPRGGQYQLELSDGSKVWLNAGTHLKVAADFNKTNRQIELDGEAYFEVNRNEKLPFTVQSGEQKIKVLGTVFNVNAYAEETLTKTTLVSGSLQVNDLLIKPNQQARYHKSQQNMQKLNVDAATAIAWKEGVFNFTGVPFDECMRIIGRWYNLDVIYETAVPAVDLKGKMGRGVKLSSFLEFLEMNTGVKAEIKENRQLIIRN